ncbi:hypothetical protein J1N35_041150, partial [Gossypium stocksii]
EYRVLRACVHGLSYLLDKCILPYLDAEGFGTSTLIRMFELRANLITAFVERWHPETCTFHLPFGECTITLEDIVLQLGLCYGHGFK